jgi:CHASE1-domain containing sensor protein
MRDFAIYTGLRVVLFAAAFGLFWLVLHNQLSIFPILLLALMASAIASIFVLRSARDRLAGTIEDRAKRISRKIEESRRAEDGE